jgi:hypothetical protein
MSYFGTQGPAQDGGFIGGIARGNARLHNAKVKRARYQKGIGTASILDFDNWERNVPGMSKFPADDILYERTNNFATRYSDYNTAVDDLAIKRITPEHFDPISKQYEADKKLIAKWAEEGPYIHETKAFNIGLIPILGGGALWLAYRYLQNRPLPRAKGSKSAFGAVFS